MAETKWFAFCCGVVEVEARDGFTGQELRWVDAAFGVSTFIESQQNRYHELKRYYTIVAQSKPRINPSTGNMIFVVVFTNKEKKVLNAARR